MPIKDIFLAVFVVGLWSGVLIVQKLSSSFIALDFFNLMRFAICIPLLFFVKKPKTSMGALSITTIFWTVLSIFFMGLAFQKGIGAGLFSLVYQTCTFFALLFSFWLLKEKPKLYQVIGMSISFLGIILLCRCSFPESFLNIGLLYALLCALSWGMGTTLIKKFHLTSDLSTNVWLAALSVFPLLALTYFQMGSSQFANAFDQLSLEVLASIVYCAYGATLLGGCLWFGLLKKHPNYLITPFMLLMPPLSCLLSYIFLGEEFTFPEILAFMVVLLGIAINQDALGSFFSVSPKPSPVEQERE